MSPDAIRHAFPLSLLLQTLVLRVLVGLTYVRSFRDLLNLLRNP